MSPNDSGEDRDNGGLCLDETHLAKNAAVVLFASVGRKVDFVLGIRHVEFFSSTYFSYSPGR